MSRLIVLCLKKRSALLIHLLGWLSEAANDTRMRGIQSPFTETQLEMICDPNCTVQFYKQMT